MNASGPREVGNSQVGSYNCPACFLEKVSRPQCRKEDLTGAQGENPRDMQRGPPAFSRVQGTGLDRKCPRLGREPLERVRETNACCSHRGGKRVCAQQTDWKSE